MRIFTPFFCFTVVLLAVSTTFAHNMVAVIPLNSSKKLENVITVSAKGGDFASPTDAIASIPATGAKAPGEANPYIIVIGPGVYTLTEALVMKPYVSISGAGLDVTTLKGRINGVTVDTNSMIIGADNVTLSDLTIENVGVNSSATALYNNSSSPVIRNVKLIGSGGSENYAVINKSSSPEMTNVIAIASGKEGSAYSIAISNGSNSSPSMKDITVVASGSNSNWGISNYASSPVMEDVTINVSGGIHNAGVYNDYGADPNMINVVIVVSGGDGSYSYGIQSESSHLTLTNVKAKVSGGTQSNGFYYNSNIDTITFVYDSSLEGSTNGVNYSASGTSSLHILNSSIIGGLAGYSPSKVTCVNSNNGVDKELDSSCAEIP